MDSDVPSPVRETIVKMLREEVQQRTGILLTEMQRWDRKAPVILLTLSSQSELSGIEMPALTSCIENKAEGFHILLNQAEGKDALWLIGNDTRGLLYAVGRFLRTAHFASKKIFFDKKNEISTSPTYSIRGHQLGFRNTNNTCDSWTVSQFEKYIRELVIFGCNSIENIPFEDKVPGSNVKISWEEMNVEMSTICENYNIDYWVWTPATVDLSDPEQFENEVKKHAAYYKKTSRINGVFVPGGDPGHNHPKYVIPFLKAIASELVKYHPEAGVWVSLQGFNSEKTDYFFHYLEAYSPDWLAGVVSGPGSPDMATTRFRLDKKYRHRHYPDITHTVRCQYPVAQWDQAFALTLGREPCNPQPCFYSSVHKSTEPYTNGSVTYSDGVHDDVNKVLWTCLDWNSELDARQILEDYSRFFFGLEPRENVADAILALENNWNGPLEQNGAVEATFHLWQTLEEQHPELKNNWRWVQLVMRAHYDAYTRHRKIYEKGLEDEATKILLAAEEIGADNAMKKAQEEVYKAETEPVNQHVKVKIEEYCEQLYQLIGMQTSVEKYHGSGSERGCVLDFVDFPLNNRWWLEDEFTKIKQMKTEEEKLARLKIIRTWGNPGHGSFYDNISDISQSPRVQLQYRKSNSYAWWDQGVSRKRLSTQVYQNFPKLIYEGLDPKATYTVRIAGEGDALLRVDGERIAPGAYPKEMETFKEFHLSNKYVSDGRIVITFDEPEEAHLNWRYHSKICDVWLLKN
ncbi:hypothetical protein [Mariniphaga anaerophila]|nr:hypothetical protein [Mariniphaga anaerophila]